MATISDQDKRGKELKRQKIDLTPERQIVTNMIVSTPFLREISLIVKSKYFESTYAQIVSIWILEYWEKYKEAPGKNIQDIYLSKRKKLRDEEEAETIAEFLKRLSKDWESLRVQNPVYSVESAVQYLKLKSLERAKEKLDEAIAADDPLSGEQIISNYTRVETSSGEGVSLLRDSAQISNAFLMEEERLFRLPGDLGIVTGDFLRGDLSAILGAPNRGKTWWLWYTGQRAALMGLKVVFFTLEMTKAQIVRRGWQSLIGAPRKTGKVEIPYFEFNEEDEKYIIKIRKEKKQGVVIEDITKKQANYRRQLRTGDIRIIPALAYSTTVDDIEAHLDNLDHYDQYIPDVVVVDYADIVASPSVRSEYRHQLDVIWKHLRRIAQQRNIAVITASQTDRSSLKKDATGANVAEDIRKLAHVSKMMVLNQSPDDYKMGIMRISQIKERDGRRNWHQAIVLQCLDIGRPYLDSKIDDKVDY
jgi:hypothetical protein